MKILTRAASLVIVTGALFFFASCGGGGEATPPEKIQLEKLSKTWNLTSVTLSTVTPGPPSQIASTFKLTISGTFNSSNPEGPYNFSVTGTTAPSPWPPSGTWEFANIGTGDSGSIIRLNDGMPMTYVISDNKLTIKFTCPSGGCDFAGARTNQVVGEWTFNLQ